MATRSGGPVTVIPAPKELQRKAGTGAIDPFLIRRSQETMEFNIVDFGPMANEFLDQLLKAISAAKTKAQPFPTLVEKITRPVMELKANAKVFHYDLVTNLANIMLGFLERLENLDMDAIEIIAAHHQTLKAIFEKQMKGAGGTYGQMLAQELRDACNRYFAKRQMQPLSVAMI